MVRTEVEIAAPPSLVREIMLDFHNVSKWHDGKWVKSIAIETPGKTHGSQLVEGDKIHTTMPGMDLQQTILTNTPSSVSWVGPWKGLLTGTSSVEFKESEKVKGGDKVGEGRGVYGLVESDDGGLELWGVADGEGAWGDESGVEDLLREGGERER